MMNSTDFRKPAFAYTLVETMVSMLIVGVATVGIVIPMLVESRKLSRQMSCQANLREWANGVLALENAHQTFPSGGVHPYPNIDRYSNGNAAFPPAQQGLGWMYQTLPYLTQDFGQPTTTSGIYEIESELFFCPARRGITRFGSNLINDYVGMTAGPSRSFLGSEWFDRLVQSSGPDDISEGCSRGFGYWGDIAFANIHEGSLRTRSELGSRYLGFFGVFVRSSHLVTHNRVVDLDYDPLTTARRIRDGLSRTGMITEKRVNIDRYDSAGPGNDRGWSDGWDYDTMRTTFCRPRTDEFPLSGREQTVGTGSAHEGGLFVVMADGRVPFVSFDINLEVWNRIGHRADGEFQIKFDGANSRN